VVYQATGRIPWGVHTTKWEALWRVSKEQQLPDGGRGDTYWVRR